MTDMPETIWLEPKPATWGAYLMTVQHHKNVASEQYTNTAKLIEWLEGQRKATGLISEDLHDRNCVYNKAINKVIQHLKEQG